MTNKKEKSSCCNALIRTMTSDESTSYYSCRECEKPCDVTPQSEKTTPEDVGTVAGKIIGKQSEKQLPKSKCTCELCWKSCHEDCKDTPEQKCICHCHGKEYVNDCHFINKDICESCGKPSATYKDTPPQQEAEWEKELYDTHSDFRVLLHSTLGFPSKGETAGSMAERIIPHIKSFISKLVKENVSHVWFDEKNMVVRVKQSTPTGTEDGDIVVDIKKHLKETRQQTIDEMVKKIEEKQRSVLSKYAYQGAPSKAEVVREKLRGEGYRECKQDLLTEIQK